MAERRYVPGKGYDVVSGRRGPLTAEQEKQIRYRLTERKHTHLDIALEVGCCARTVANTKRRMERQR